MGCDEKSTPVSEAERTGAKAVSDNRWVCPTCRSKGFDVSELGPDRCTFCDGTEGGNPPTAEEIAEAQRLLVLMPDGVHVMDPTGATRIGDTLKVETYRHTIEGFADLVWNVSRAKWEVAAGHTIATVAMDAEALRNIVDRNEWDPIAVERANPGTPGIGAPFLWQGQIEYLLIDGTHRAVKTYQSGGALTFAVHLLSDEAAARCLISGDERLLPWRRR